MHVALHLFLLLLLLAVAVSAVSAFSSQKSRAGGAAVENEDSDNSLRTDFAVISPGACARHSLTHPLIHSLIHPSTHSAPLTPAFTVVAVGGIGGVGSTSFNSFVDKQHVRTNQGRMKHSGPHDFIGNDGVTVKRGFIYLAGDIFSSIRYESCSRDSYCSITSIYSWKSDCVCG